MCLSILLFLTTALAPYSTPVLVTVFAQKMKPTKTASRQNSKTDINPEWVSLGLDLLPDQTGTDDSTKTPIIQEGIVEQKIEEQILMTKDWTFIQRTIISKRANSP